MSEPEETRSLVETLAGYGLADDQIAILIDGGISPDELRDRFAREMETGSVKAKAKIAETLFSQAANGNTAAMLAWIKASEKAAARQPKAAAPAAPPKSRHLPNAKHERFAQALAAGVTTTAAYVEAGYRANDGNASTLKADQRISKRVAVILGEREHIHSTATAKAIEAGAITKIGHLESLAELRDAAKAAGDFGPAVSAEVSRGKVAGFYIDRKEIRTGMLDDRSNEELRAIEAALAADESGDASGDSSASVH